jgi:hypothetical protein
MFAGMDAAVQADMIDDFVAAEKTSACEFILTMLANEPSSFVDVWIAVLQRFTLRVTNVKDICVRLSRDGRIENTWGAGNRKPRDADIIKLRVRK